MFLYLHKIVNKIISWLMFITPTSLYIYIYIISYIEYSKCLLFIFNIYWMFLSYVYNILSVWECKKKVLEGAKTIVLEVSFINFFKKDMFSKHLVFCVHKRTVQSFIFSFISINIFTATHMKLYLYQFLFFVVAQVYNSWAKITFC